MRNNKKYDGIILLAAVLLFTACGPQGEGIPLTQLTVQDNAVPAAAGDEEVQQQMEVSTVWVHICGEVLYPGVYELPADSRVYDGIMAAGGFTFQGDREALNLAGCVSDGMQIVVPNQDAGQGQEGTGVFSLEEQSGLININTATLEQLICLPGIGESRAKDIIAYREANGNFQTKEQIMEVSGIKTAVFEKIKEAITVGK